MSDLPSSALDTLEGREELHRSIVSGSPHPIFLVDLATRRLVDANPATSSMLGYTREELLDATYDVIDLEAAREDEDVLERVRLNHHDILGERVYRRRDGTTLQVEASGNLVIHARREVVCVFARDISHRIDHANERVRLERALALSQKHQTVGQLAAGIAHDFNNNLMVIQLCAQMVQNRLDVSDANWADLDELIRTVKGAGELPRQLLAFSGRQLLRPSLVDVDALLQERYSILHRAMGDSVAVEVNPGADGATVFVDETQLEQVVLNLALNARDAMPEGGRLLIETSRAELSEDFVRDYATLRSGPHVLILVRDTGHGMDETTLNRVFEPFFTTKGETGGTGLGLATAYGIVKQSGGSIWATSEPERGTTFRVYLPITTESVEPVHTQDLAPSPVGGRETILVVDDDERLRALVARSLRELGYRVLEASTAEEAIAIYTERARGDIDLLLSDIGLPGMSGTQLFKEVGARGETPKVVFMTGYAGKGVVDDLAGDDYLLLEKPLGRIELADAVRTTLDRD